MKVTNLSFFIVAKAIIYIQLQSGLEKAASQEIMFVPFRNCVTSASGDCELLRSGMGLSLAPSPGQLRRLPPRCFCILNLFSSSF